jgi:zinc-ribbon domain
MFCPKCAAENLDTAQFCRGCGANISLVPQAVAGQLAQRGGEESHRSRRDRRHRERHGEAVTIDRAVRSFFMGLAFIFVAFAVKTWAPAGNIWWFWMFLPAAAMLADGVGTYLRLREKRQGLAAPPAYSGAPPSFAPPPRAAGLPPRNTGELVQPPSVTEATTRHLGVPSKRNPEDA